MWSTVLFRGRRRFYSLFVDPISAITQKKVHYSEERLLGYSPEQVYEVVADVDSYKFFLPWCQESSFTRQGSTKSIAKMSIGFPPLIESYTALIQTDPPHSLRDVSTDGSLFSHLENSWQFKDGPKMSGGPTCIVKFWVNFEFRSVVTARLGSVFFDEVARAIAGAFEKRCIELYGPSHLKKRDLNITANCPFRTNPQT